jgi:uncharacterized sulfatase
MQNDLGDQFVHIFQQFWPYYLMLIAYLILYYKSLKMLNLKFSLSGLIHQLFSTNLSLKGTAKYVCMILLILVTSTLAIRGGLIRKPLSPTHAYIDGDNGFANLRLNSVFTLIKSNLDARVETPKYMAIDEAIKALDVRGDGDQTIPPKVISFEQKPNIVLIIVESLSTEYMGIVDDLPNYTPFLSSLAQRSVFFPNFFANGRRSIDSVPSLLFSLPNYLREPFVNSPYRSNRIEGLGSQLKKINYDSYFFHGGKNGTMFFDVMAYKAGFDRYYGLEEYPEKDHFDGAWGIYDSYYFDYFANELDHHYLENPSKPFFATLFSLSSHNPYKIPPELNDRYKDGTLNIHKSIRYADDSLRKLFIKLKKLKWYENTVFFITGDHAAELDSAKYNNRYGKYMVPMIVYSPKIKPYMDLRIAHQLDFSPTVLSLVGGDIKRLNKFGNNLLSGTTGSSSSFSFYRSGRVFKLISQNGEVTISEDGSINWKDSIKDMIIRDGTTLSFPYSQFNKITSSTVNRSREVDEMILKSTVQYHHQSMNEDRF